MLSLTIKAQSYSAQIACNGSANAPASCWSIPFSRNWNAATEQAAHAACEKFIRRFAAMEAAAADSGVPLEQRTLAQMQPLWQQAKQTASADNEGKKSARQ